MFRPIHGHQQVDCLKFPLCNKFHYVTELWCGDLNISLCYGVSIGSIGEERWMETNYMLFWWRRGLLPGVKCRQGSLGVVLLACYARPTVGPDDGHELAETCRWLISGIYILPIIYLCYWLLSTYISDSWVSACTSQTHTRTHARTNTHTPAHAHTHTRAQTYTHTYTRTRTHTHTHMYIYT